MWITLYLKGEADKVNKTTVEMLIQIQSNAKAIAQVAMPELRAYGDSMRQLLTLKSKEIEKISAIDNSSI